MNKTFPQSVQNEIENFEKKTDEELFEILGAYALSQQPDTLRKSLAVDAAINPSTLNKAARDFLTEIKPVLKDALCGPDGIAEYMEKPTVRDVIIILLPAFGISISGIMPTAIIAISIILVRSGIREYCKQTS